MTCIAYLNKSFNLEKQKEATFGVTSKAVFEYSTVALSSRPERLRVIHHLWTRGMSFILQDVQYASVSALVCMRLHARSGTHASWS